MNGYVCLWQGKRCEVKAETMLQAQALAVAEFQRGTRKKVKRWDITVVLAEKGGEQVTHTPCD